MSVETCRYNNNVFDYSSTAWKEEDVQGEVLQAANWWQNKVEAWHPSIEGDPALPEKHILVHQQAALYMVQYIACTLIECRECRDLLLECTVQYIGYMS